MFGVEVTHCHPQRLFSITIGIFNSENQSKQSIMIVTVNNTHGPSHTPIRGFLTILFLSLARRLWLSWRQRGQGDDVITQRRFVAGSVEWRSRGRRVSDIPVYFLYTPFTQGHIVCSRPNPIQYIDLPSAFAMIQRSA